MIALLEHASAPVRCTALVGLSELPAAEHAKAMGAIVARMQDADPAVRRTALAALCGKHAPTTSTPDEVSQRQTSHQL